VLSVVCFVLAGAGLSLLLAQLLAVRWYLSRPLPVPTATPGFSVLKPLCGLDDELEQNLRAFAALEWPRVEVLLGVKDLDDAAFPLARRMARAFPERFRVVVQRGAPANNPKVNQLITLEREARFELLMVSDSNAVLGPHALAEIAALFEDPSVGCVANPVSGRGHQTFGALLDNLHLAAFLGAGQIGAKVGADRDFIVGKSMTLRRELLRAMGGFGAFGDFAAEDFAIGQAVRALGLRNVIAQHPVWNVAVNRTVGSFFERYRRWAILQRTGVSFVHYVTQVVLNPWPLALLGALLMPSAETFAAVGFIFLLRAALDGLCAHRLQLRPSSPALIPAVAVKDLLLLMAFIEGLFRRTIRWRGNRLVVAQGGRLVRPAVAGEALEGAR